MTDEESATVVRLDTDGSLDRSFGGDGIASSFSDAPVSAAAVQPDGKLVVAGATQAGDITVARLDTDGSLDETFGPAGAAPPGRLRRSGTAGANRVRFSGRIGRRALPRGRYRLTVRATDAAGNRSAARSTTFRIVR